MKMRHIFGLTALLGAGFYTPQTQSNYTNVPRSFYQPMPNTCEQPLEEKLTIEEQTQKLNNQHGYGITSEDLVFITRVTYMEAGNDKKAKTQEDLQRGWQGVAQVILNRYLFDKNNQTHLFSKQTSLRGIVQAKQQFHPVMFFPKIFDEKNFYNKEKKLSLSYERISPKRIAKVYDTVISVLKQEEEDITKGAVFFHADYVEKGRKAGTRPFSVHKKPCLTTENGQINTHKFFGTTCPIDPYATSEP